MAVHENSLKNLAKPFVKGESGNPSGKSKGMMIWTYVKELKDLNRDEIEAIIADSKAPARKVACAQYMLRALNGDAKVLEFMIEREDGKATITQNTTMSVQGLQQIGQDITPQDTKQVQSIVNTITEASSAKDALLAKMNVDIIDKD